MSSLAAAGSDLRESPAVASSSGAGHRAVLVRPWAGRSRPAGCCGGVEGVVSTRPHHELASAVGDTAADPTGAAYEALRVRFPDLELTVADSRNWLWLLPSVYGEARRRAAGRPRAALAAARATTPGCLVVDGEVCLVEVLDPGEAVDAVARRLG